MKEIRVTIAVKETAYGNLLAQAMAETERMLDITVTCRENLVYDEKESGRILITDFEPEQLQKIVVWPSAQILRLENKLLSVSEILCLTCEMAYSTEEKKEKIYSEDSLRTKVFGFYSPWGGSGTTSITIAAGRLLCGMTGEKVLYLNLTAKDQYRVYMEEGTAFSGGKKELIYRLKEGASFYPSRFMIRDSWGLYFLKPEAKGNTLLELDEKTWPEILRRLIKEADINLILLDLGSDAKESMFDLCENFFCVVNKQECRSKLKREKAGNADNEMIVENRSFENKRCENLVQIEEDTESFVAEGEKIKLSLNKSFAAGVRYLAEKIEETRKEAEIR